MQTKLQEVQHIVVALVSSRTLHDLHRGISFMSSLIITVASGDGKDKNDRLQQRRARGTGAMHGILMPLDRTGSAHGRFG